MQVSFVVYYKYKVNVNAGTEATRVSVMIINPGGTYTIPYMLDPAHPKWLSLAVSLSVYISPPLWLLSNLAEPRIPEAFGRHCPLVWPRFLDSQQLSQERSKQLREDRKECVCGLSVCGAFCSVPQCSVHLVVRVPPRPRPRQLLRITIRLLGAGWWCFGACVLLLKWWCQCWWIVRHNNNGNRITTRILDRRKVINLGET